MIDEKHTEQVEFPKAGYRARRWTRFERDLYEWLNRPEGQFECWLAKRKLGLQEDESRQEPQRPLTTT